MAENGSEEATSFPGQQQPPSLEHSIVGTPNMDIGTGIAQYPTEKDQRKVGGPLASQPSNMDNLNVDIQTGTVQYPTEKAQQKVGETLASQPQHQKQDSGQAASSSEPQDAAKGQEQESKKAMSSKEKQGEGKTNEDKGEEVDKDVTDEFLPMLGKKKRDPEIVETQKDMFKNADVIEPGIALKKFALAISGGMASSTYMAALGVENITMYKLAKPKLCGICIGDFKSSPENFWTTAISHPGAKAIAAIFVPLPAGISTEDDT